MAGSYGRCMFNFEETAKLFSKVIVSFYIPTRSVWEWIISLNMKPKTIKLLEENIEKKFCDLGLNKDFFNVTPKEWSIGEQIHKLDFIKIKHSALQRSQLREWKSESQMEKSLCKEYIW